MVKVWVLTWTFGVMDGVSQEDMLYQGSLWTTAEAAKAASEEDEAVEWAELYDGEEKVPAFPGIEWVFENGFWLGTCPVSGQLILIREMEVRNG